MSPRDALHLPWPWTLAVAAFAASQVVLLGYAAHRLVTLWRWAHRPAPAPPDRLDGPIPMVTVQLPLYNERAVAERLIDATASLDWPAHRLEIQVLDDSTDDTRERVAQAVEHWRARGISIAMLHRDERRGFKAGALADGLDVARGEIVVVFDADFVPPPDFLQRIVPYFADPAVGMVQARWGHLNRDRSLLTRAQAAMLDAHFRIEHEARMSAGLFFNFNGTAGAWRRRCIEDAGGWSHDTLTEDLDLSYRAQLAGWRFVIAPEVVVPAELPSHVLALRSQQRRWARGSIQTARKILPGLWRSRLPLRVRLEATFHLTANSAYVLTLVAGLLLPAVLAVPSRLPHSIAVALDLAALAIGLVPVGLFLLAGQRAGTERLPRALADVASALLVGAGLAVNNTIAVCGGLLPSLGAWERTPKTGEDASTMRADAYRARPDLAAIAEVALALAFACAAVWAWNSGHTRSAPFLLLMAGGLGLMGTLSLLARWRPRHSSTSAARHSGLPERA